MRRLLVLFALAFAFAAHAEPKNVKLLTGLSDLEMQRVMNMMRGSLGVHCDYCHVTKSGEWNFALDDKPAKTRAREMIRMTMDVNRTAFGGKPVVSCFTCHRGSRTPATLIALPQAKPVFPTPPLPQPDGLPEAKSLVAKYAAALGDVSRLRSRVLTGERTNTEGTSAFEVREKGAKVYVRAGEIEQVYDGAHGWMKDKDGVKPLSPRMEDLMRVLIDAYALVLPADIGETAKTIGKENDTYVVALGPRRFHFDAASGLLVRSVTLTPTPIGTIPQQVDYEDYRDAGGVKAPFRVRVSFVDPWVSATRQYKTMELVPLEDGVFTMPQ